MHLNSQYMMTMALSEHVLKCFEREHAASSVLYGVQFGFVVQSCLHFIPSLRVGQGAP